MKLRIAFVMVATSVLCGCTTGEKPTNEVAISSKEVYFAYNYKGSSCYARLLEGLPSDGICVKGDYLVYDASITVPREYKPMPEYVAALFDSKNIPQTGSKDRAIPSQGAQSRVHGVDNGDHKELALLSKSE